MTMKHTPGPWFYGRQNENESGAKPIAYLSASRDPRNFTVWAFADRVRASQEDDARLIAAAPDLLAALQEIVKNDPYHQSSAGIIARAAIAKATGENQ